MPALFSAGIALHIDSFDFPNLLIGFHESLGIEIPESDCGKLTTRDSMVRCLSRRLASTSRRAQSRVISNPSKAIRKQ